MEANVIKSSERRPADVFDGVVRHQEVLLPPHKYVVGVCERLVVKRVRIERLRVLAKRIKLTLQIINTKINKKQKKNGRQETYPVFFVDVLVGVPLARKKRVLLADDLSIEERSQCGKLIRQSIDL